MSRVLLNSENRISCAYGPYKTTNPALKGKMHNGVDIAPSTNEEENKIYTNCKGIVYEIQDGLNRNVNATGKSSWGNFVLVKHPNGMFTRYAHLQKGTIQVAKGQEVDENTYLGMMGESGVTYGRHLHYEVATGYSSTTRIDPTPYLIKAVYEENAQNNENNVQSETSKSEECTTTDTFKVGDKVLVLSGYATADSYGGGSHTAEYDGNINDESNIKYITDIVDLSRLRPYHLSNDKENTKPRGWVSAEQIRKI